MTRVRILPSAVVAPAAVLLSVFFGGVGYAAPAAPHLAAAGEATYSYDFHDAQIAQVAAAIFGDLGVQFSVDPSVTGRMSFRIDQRLTKPQLLQAFEAALAANNVALVRNGDSLVITADAKARSMAGVRPAAERSGVGYQVVAVPLTYASPTEVAKAIEAISGTGSVIYASDRLGLILLGGSGQELQSALETVKMFDQNGLQNSHIRWFELSQAPATSVAAELDDMLKAAGVTGVTVAPLRRLNGLIVISRSGQGLDDIANWVFRLDQPTKDTVSSLWVYHPKNTTAEALAQTINSVLGGQVATQDTTTPQAHLPTGAPSSLAAPETVATATTSDNSEDQVRAAVDKETNTLLVSAPAWRWTKIEKILAQIDRPQAQILIEARIVEVTLTNDFRFGIDWSVIGAGGRLNVTNTSSDTGAIAPIYPGFSVSFVDTNLQAVLNALGAHTSMEVVSAPKLLTLDNHTARLEVGDQVPIVTQQSQSTATANAPVLNTVDYRNSGVIMNVTPRISGDNRIVLDVQQEVSSAIKTVSSGIDSPTIQERKLQSTLVVNDGGVVALGGLISNTHSSGDSGIPWIKDIPAVGALFRSTNRNLNRTELVVLLSAHIVKEGSGEKSEIGDLLEDMREIQAHGLLDHTS